MTQMNADDLEEINFVTEQIIGCAFKVSNASGIGFLEKIYENALVIELERSGLVIEQQKLLDVFYDGILVGQYNADLIVNGEILLELKAVRAIDEAHQAQLLNYLKATGLRIGLVLNFGSPRLGIKRMIL